MEILIFHYKNYKSMMILKYKINRIFFDFFDLSDFKFYN